MSRRNNAPLDAKIYVGGLSEEASRGELEVLFSRYGRLRSVWVARRPPGFAFIEFEDARDAADAARALDGTKICGRRARVEISHGRSRNNDRDRPSSGRLKDWGGDRGGYSKFRDRERSPNGMRGRSRSRSRSPVPRRYSRSRSASPRENGAGRKVSESRSND